MKPIRERFWLLVRVTEEDMCWEWLGNTTEKGYGQLPVSTEGHRRAHRLAFELSGGILQDDEIVCHTCDNPSCCNPKHLFAGTHQDNRDDCVKKNRQAKGMKAGNFGKFGSAHPAFGHVKSPEGLRAIAEAKMGDNSPSRKYRVVCKYCGKESGCGQHSRWHGENCKNKGVQNA